MNNQEKRQLIKLLSEKKKELKNKNIQPESGSIIKRPKIDNKYVTDSDYKELVALYEFMKEKTDYSIVKICDFIEKNSGRFPFLKKCYNSIYDFVSYLKCNGPYYIAKEMCRQGKEVDYINNNIFKSNKNN